MGTLGGSDADNGPSDGGLSWLPPDWGSIVLPDDLSELADEVSQVRRELRREARRRRRGRILRTMTGADVSGWIPVLLVIVAVLGLLFGMFKLGYDGSRHAAPPERGPTAGQQPRTTVLPAVDLIDRDGRAVAVRSLLPAVLLFVDGCACDDLITKAARSAPPGVSVLVVGDRVPAVPTGLIGTERVRALADPAGGLRALVGFPPPTTRPGVLLVDGSATIELALPAVTSADQFQADIVGISPD